jgi:hypothetical protein
MDVSYCKRNGNELIGEGYDSTNIALSGLMGVYIRPLIAFLLEGFIDLLERSTDDYQLI